VDILSLVIKGLLANSIIRRIERWWRRRHPEAKP
jgi:hypothetical protein